MEKSPKIYIKRNVDGPDGVEAWCVALAACFINFVMAGLGRMSGILYVAFIEIFQVDRLQASVPFSVRSLARNLFGPVVGILGQKYGVRATTLMGGILGTLSCTICFYANSMVWITILWGLVNGMGSAMSLTLPQVVLGQHFKKYRTTAAGMAFSGGCVGSFFFPVLLEFLLKAYGLAGTFLILSGILMNVIPAAMLLRKPSWLKRQSTKTATKSTMVVGYKNQPDKCVAGREITQNKNYENDAVISRTDNSLQEFEKKHYLKRDDAKALSRSISQYSEIDSKFLEENCGLVIKMFSNYCPNMEINDDNCVCCMSTDTFKICFSGWLEMINSAVSNYCVLTDLNTNGESSRHRNYVPTNNFEKEHIENNKRETVLSVTTLESSSIEEFNKFLKIHCTEVIKEDVNNILMVFLNEDFATLFKIIEQLRHINDILDKNAIKSYYPPKITTKNDLEKSSDKAVEMSPTSNTFYAHIKTCMKIHKNPIFVLISLCRSVHFLTFIPAVTVIVDFSMDKGLLEEDGKYVIAALSFGDLIGRLCLGWVTDKEYLSLPKYMLSVMVMQGLCTASLSLMYSRAAFLSVVSLFGLLQGSLFIRHTVLVSKYLGSHEQSVAMGCMNFMSGLLGFALPNYIGYFRDTIGSYDYIFYINGAIGTFIGIMWFFEPFFFKCIKQNQESLDPS